MNTKDQKQHWDKLHKNSILKPYSEKETDFAAESLQQIANKEAVLLDLGCGVGNDSAFFAQNVGSVVGTDFSDVTIANNTKRYSQLKNLEFIVHDTSQAFDFADESFDVVYARLSLHYFPDELMRQIFAEIHRVLTPGGKLFFMCKSTEDSIYGEGRLIENDMFEREGHVRHFFSEQYSRDLLADKFMIHSITSGKKKLYDKQSAYLKVSASKI